MGRASISIAITSNFNSSGIDAAIRKAEQLATAAVHHQGQFGKAAVDMGASMGLASSRLVSMGKAVADMGDRLTMGVTVPMGLAATAAVMAATKIDTAWYNVRKTVDMTEEGYQRLKESAMALAETQPVDAETILNIEALGGQLGIANDQLENFAKVVSGLDIATNLDSQTAATELAQFRNQVQMSEDELDNMGSTIVDLGNHTATTESDLLNLAMRFASAGHIAGMSNAEILGLSAALSGLGMKAEAGGSALSRTINDINNAVSMGGDKLQKWADLVGKTPEQFTEAWRAAPTDEFIDVLNHIGDAGEEMGVVLDELGITQLRQSDAMRRLASSGDYVRETVERANQAWRENTALTREVENRNESLQARWDTFVNRLTNDLATVGKPIAEIGLDVLEGLEPVLDIVGSVAEAFANASPDVQRFAFNLGAVAMAAGPVLSVAGRIMQAIGNVGQAVGRGYQSWGRYREGLKTTDMTMLTTLSNSRDLASQLGASRNPIVKAAGGIATFNAAYAKTTDEIKIRNKAQVQAEFGERAYTDALANGNKTEREALAIAERAARSNKARAEWTRRIKQETQELNDSIDAGNVNLKLNTANVTKAEREAAKASLSFGKFGDALKGALLGFGGMAAAGVAIAGITWIATQMQLAAERAENLRLATDGLHDSLTRTSGAAEEQNHVWGSSVAAVDEAIEKQAQLGKVFEQNNTAAQTSIHSLDRASEAIRNYANRSGLSASEQYQLKSAIDTVNEACGTQLSVVDAANGKIADESGAIQENTDAILENIEARKRQIELQAIEANYQAAYEQELTTKKALRDVQNEFNDAMERYDTYQRKIENKTPLSGEELDDYKNLTTELGNIGERLNAAREAAKEAGESTEFWDEQLRKVSEAAETVAGSYAQMLASDVDFSVAFEGIQDADTNLQAFAARTRDLGILVESLGNLGPDSANKIAEGFDGSAQSIVKSMEGIDEASGILTNIGNNWRISFSEATQSIIDSVVSAKGYTLAELSAMAVDFGVKGEQATNAFMRALEQGIQPEKAAELARRLDEAFGENLTPENAEQAIQAYLDALAGKLGDTSPLDAAIQSLKSSLGMVSFESEGAQAMSTFFAGMGVPVPEGFAGVGEVVTSEGERVGHMGGQSLSDGWVAGVGEGQPQVESSAQGLIGSLIQSLMGGVPQAESAGQQTGQGYGDSVSGQGSVAEAAAMNTLGRLLQIWLLGIVSAQQAGIKTGQAYGQGVQSSASQGVAAVANAVQAMVGVLNMGVMAAALAGSNTGRGYATMLANGMNAARAQTLVAVSAIVTALVSGVAPATAAGLNMGNGFANALNMAGSRAIGYATTISRAVSSAFASATGNAERAGTALGNAFARGVQSSASKAVDYARNASSAVKNIFDNLPTATIRVNVQRTTTGSPSSFGGHPVRYASLGTQAPAYRIAGYAAIDRAATVAERAVERVSVRTSQSSPAAQVGAAVMQVASSGTAAIDYDAMYRVVKSGVKAAIDESGGLAPDIRLDGKSIVDHVDRELGRRQQMWG